MPGDVIVDALNRWQERRILASYSPDELRRLWEDGVSSRQPRPLATDMMKEIRDSVHMRLVQQQRLG